MINGLLIKQQCKELVSKREACVKVFENEDHTMTAAIYDQPVHFMADGCWQEIDNRLVDGAEEAGDVENMAGPVKIRLSNKAKEKQMVRIGQGQTKLGWGLVGCTPAKRQMLPEDVTASEVSADTSETMSDASSDMSDEEVRSILSVSHIRSGVCYSEVLPQVDAVYMLDGGKVKENLILKGTDASYIFKWRYQTGKLAAEQAGTAILFKNEEGEIVYTLEAPYMQDAKGERSTELTLFLEADDKGKEALVTLTADEAWLAAEDRAWPVTIDPVVSTPTKVSAIQDCHVSSFNCTDNFYQSIILKTGCIDGSLLRTYLKFNLPAIDKTADMVVAARFYITKDNSTAAKRYIDIHKVTEDWKNTTITWENKPAYDPKVVDFTTFAMTEQASIGFDVTDLVKDWYQNGKNYGLLMKDHDETGNYTHYLSSDCDDTYASLRPRILIQYVNYSGLEDYWTYHSQSVRRAGTGHVNDYNGNLVFVHDTLSMTGSRMPLALSHVFNSNDRAVNMGYGRGFRLSCHQTIEPETIGSIQYYRYVDGDGTAHYFRKGTDGIWKDESGLDLTLTVSTDENTMYTIKAKDDTKLIFRVSGRLAKIADANGNAMSMTYSSGKLVKLEDGSGRTAAFTYGSDGNMASMTTPSGQVKTFTYDTGGRLTGITDVDGKICTFAYDSNGMLLKAADPFGYSMNYTYYSQSPYRVKKVEEKAGSTAGQSLTMAYGWNQTKFTDQQGRSQYYLFNNAGNTVSVRDDAGYGAAWKYDGTKVNRLSQLSDLQYIPVQFIKGVTGGLPGWGSYANGDTVSITTDDSTAYVGKASIKISNTGTSGYGMVFQNVALTPGKNYVFSAYAKTRVDALLNGPKVWLRVKSGDTVLVPEGAAETPGYTGWRRVSVAFTVPASSAASTVIKLEARTAGIRGDVWFDGFQLEEGEAASRLNLLENNNFTYDLYHLTKAGGAGSDDTLVPVGTTSDSLTLKGTVLKKDINARTGAGMEFDIMTVVKQGTQVDIVGADYDKDGVRWYVIKLTVDGKATWGYMMGTYLSLNGPAGSVTVKCIAADGNLNIRSGPGTSHTSLLQVARGQKMTVNGAGKDSSGLKWYKVSFRKDGKDYTGYVSSEYVAVYYPAEIRGKVANTSVLNVRRSPGMDYPVLAVLDRNDALSANGRTVLADGTVWHYVVCTKDGTRYVGFVDSQYVTETARMAPPLVTVKAPETVPAGNGPLGSRAFMIEGDEKQKKRLVYTLQVAGKKGDAYVAGAWGCGHPAGMTEITDGDGRKDRHFGICVNFTSADGKEESHYADFGSDASGWQYLSDVFVAKQDYDHIYVCYCHYNQANAAYFTGLSLFKEAFGTSFVYDSKGNVTSVTDKAKKAGKFEYDAGNNVAKMIDPKGKSFTYTYDGKHNVKTAKSAAGLSYAFTYDAYGNPLTVRVVNPDAPENAASAMTAKAAYTTGSGAGQYMASQTSPEGHTTTYTWDGAKGQLKTVTDGSGSVTKYSYDEAGRLKRLEGYSHIGESTGDRNITYTYDKDRMVNIRHHGFDYHFTYDGFGNRTGVAIAGTTVLANTYADRNGLLTKSRYGNGWEISYTYDKQDRVTAVTAQKDGVVYQLCSYIYDKQGLLARVADGQDSGRSCTYGYDLTGRLCEARLDNGQMYRYTYDANDCLIKEETTTADGTRTVNRTYDADSRETAFTCGTARVTVTYDKLGRVQTVKHGTNHTTAYTYAAGSGGGQTGQLKRVANGLGTVDYTYDARGNVLTAVSGGRTHRYVYDEQSQLLREDDPVQNKTIVYLYDGGGSLAERRVYSLTTAGDLSGLAYTEQVFARSDTWTDQLAAVDGQAYTYDAIGNLLSDGTRTYTWQHGRQLKAVTEANKRTVYTYDVDGIRTSKSVNGVKTEYLTAGGRVLSEKKGSTWQHYLYDAGGMLHAIRYKGADYYYIRDGLMNIVGLVDTGGVAVVRYQYDGWGKLLGVTGSMAATLGQDNPYRYKGYYYDAETGFYYLGSRYYNPEICRFISADNIDVLVTAPRALINKNIYLYCDNNPITRIDINGALWQFILIGAAINVYTTYFAALATGQDYTFIDGLVAAAAGAVGAIPGFWWVPFAGAVISCSYTMFTARKNGASEFDAILAGIVAFASTVFTGGSLATMLKLSFSIWPTIAIGASFSMGGNMTSAAVYKGVTDSGSQNHSSPTVSQVSQKAVNAGAILGVHVAVAHPPVEKVVIKKYRYQEVSET